MLGIPVLYKVSFHCSHGKNFWPRFFKTNNLVVKVLLNFQMLYLKFANIFCWKNVRSFCKCEKLLQMWEAFAKASFIFSTKNIRLFGYKVIKHLTSWPLNKLVKQIMLWTTGPRSLSNKKKWKLKAQTQNYQYVQPPETKPKMRPTANICNWTKRSNITALFFSIFPLYDSLTHNWCSDMRIKL